MPDNNKKLSHEEIERMISSARYCLKDFLEDFYGAYPRIGLSYSKSKWSKILNSFDEIKAVGEDNNLIVELASDGTRYVFYEYIIHKTRKIHP